METRKISRVYDVELRSKRTEEHEEESREVEGYAVVFNQKTDIAGLFDEEIDSRAFNECDMSNVYLLFNHDENNVLAGTANGSLNMEINEHGLIQRSEIIDTSIGEDVLKLVKKGLINKMSFGFIIAEDGQEWSVNEVGKDVRKITKIERLLDVSLVTYPAYPQTSAYARSESDVDELAKCHLELKEKLVEQDKRMGDLFKDE